MFLIMAAAMMVHLFCKPRDGHHADHQFNKFLYHCLVHLLLILLLKPIRICRSPSDFSNPNDPIQGSRCRDGYHYPKLFLKAGMISIMEALS